MATMLSSGWGARRRRRRTEGIILGSWIARRRVVWCVVGHDFLLLRCLWRQPGGNPGHRTAERGMREKEERRGEKKNRGEKETTGVERAMDGGAQKRRDDEPVT
jgi:hypothetical protein